MKYNLFTIPFWKTEIETDFNQLIDDYYVIESQDSGRIRSNRGGWQSNFKSTDSELFDIIIDQAKQFAKTLQINTNLRYDGYWININRYKDSNIIHFHPNSLISGVFYVKTPENSGKLVFHHPSEDLMIVWKNVLNDFNNANSQLWRFEPKQGELYLFPGWLKHSVEPHMNEKEDRISISFNFGI